MLRPARFALILALILAARVEALHAAEPKNNHHKAVPPVEVILPEEDVDFKHKEEGGIFKVIRRSITRLFGKSESGESEPKKAGKKEEKKGKKTAKKKDEGKEKKAGKEKAAAETKDAKAKEEPKKKEPGREVKVAEPSKEEIHKGFMAKVLDAITGPLRKVYSIVAGLAGKPSVEPEAEPDAGVAQAPGMPPPIPGGEKASTGPTPGFADAAVFQRGYSAFRRGSCGPATETLAFLLQKYPNSSTAGPALYIMGECLFRIGRADQNSGRPRRYKLYYRLADNAFRDATLRFPSSPLAAHGYYRIIEMAQYLGFNTYVLGMGAFFREQYPDSDYRPRVDLMVAKSQANLREFDSSRKTLLGVVYDHPDAEQVTEAIFSLADLDVILGRYEDSLTVYNEGNKRWPRFIRLHPEAMLKLALAFEKTQFFDEALSLLFYLQGQYGRREFADEVQLRIANVLALKKDYSNAANAYAKVVGQYKGSESVGYALLGLADIALQRPVRTKLRGGWWATDEVNPEAIYRGVARHHPLQPQAEAALYKLSLLMFTQRRYDESLRALERMMKTFPYGRFAKGARGDLYHIFKDGIGYYYEAGDYMTVLKLHDSYIESPFLRGAFDLDVLYVLGKSFYEMGLYAKAREFLYRVIQKWPTKEVDEHCGYLIGVTYLREGDFARAEEILKKHLDFFPSGKYRNEMLYALGEATYNQGKFPEAIAALGQFLVAQPESPRAVAAFYFIGNSLFTLKKYLEASEAYVSVLALASKQKSREVPPAVLESHFQLADSFYMAGLYGPALKAYEEAYRLSSKGEKGEWAQYRMSYIKELLKSPKEALKGYEALASSPDPMWQTISSGLRDFARAREVYRGYFKAPE
ncbi:MAG: tetratricopeptide repeat protein [Nitrospirae bacterium]|nr:tetratricopeptide repeat protein [Nitrospirota bacterium]